MLKHLRYIGEGLALIGAALGLVAVIILAEYVLTVISHPWLLAGLMLLVAAWVAGWIIRP